MTTDDERLIINQLIHQINFESALLNFFPLAVHSVAQVTGVFVGLGTDIISTAKTDIKTFFTFDRYRLNGGLNGDAADFRIQSSSKTYSHVVIKVDKVFGVTKIRDAFTRSCNCGETVYLN